MRSLGRGAIARGFIVLSAIALACGDDSSTNPSGPPAAVGISGSATGSADPGKVVNFQPSIRVTDAGGHPVSGVRVTTQLPNGGSLQNPNPRTNSDGVASVGNWTLGPSTFLQSLILKVEGLPPVTFTVNKFSVDIRFVGGTPSDTIQAAFDAAALRISQVVTTRLTEVTVSNRDAADDCGQPGLPTLNEKIENVVIFAMVVPIDGVNGVIGSSGPCGLRPSNKLPVFGLMLFDSADLSEMGRDGSLNSVVLHEMLHVLGFGVLWEPQFFPLLQNPSTSNPIYTGARARTEFLASGGATASGVPVEGGNIEGTSNSHWRESVFRSELMTGFLSGSTQPFSRISIAALEDMGYAVTYDTADPFSLTSPGLLRSIFDAELPMRQINERLIRPKILR